MIFNLNVIIEELRWQEVLDEDIKEYSTKICMQVLQKANFITSSNLEANLLLTDDKEVQKLNKEFRGQDKPTNVLSFPFYSDLEKINKNELHIHLGDIAMAFETVKKETDNFLNHFTHLTAHGMLHLLGYDHQDDDEAKKMENLEIEILNSFGIDNPYTYSNYE